MTSFGFSVTEEYPWNIEQKRFPLNQNGGIEYEFYMILIDCRLILKLFLSWFTPPRNK